jgi:hypothetical protein
VKLSVDPQNESEKEEVDPTTCGSERIVCVRVGLEWRMKVTLIIAPKNQGLTASWVRISPCCVRRGRVHQSYFRYWSRMIFWRTWHSVFKRILFHVLAVHRTLSSLFWRHKSTLYYTASLVV